MNMCMHSYIHSNSKTRIESNCNMLLGHMGVHACAHAYICTHTRTNTRIHKRTHTEVLLKFISTIYVSGLNLKRCVCGM